MDLEYLKAELNMFNSYPDITQIPAILYVKESLNGNIFRVTVPLCGELTGNRWIPLTKASDEDVVLFEPEQTIE